MPKKFQGTNTKSLEARARKAAAVASEVDRKHKEAEDEYWKDDNKHAVRKMKRKEMQEQKRVDALNRKKELESLYKSEEEGLKRISKSSSSSKVTRAEIETARRKEEQDKVAKESNTAIKLHNISVPNDEIEENINQVLAKQVTAGDIEARSVQDALTALSVKEEIDRHPERRLKASYKKYEQDRMPVLKAANPEMRMSQLRQVLKKEWQKSPENPLNQKHLAYNSK